MNNRTIASVVLTAATALALGDLALHYPGLPEKIASHFGPGGHADGWADKSASAIFIAGIFLFDTLMFASVSGSIRRLPDEKINLPHKGYWLSPTRRDFTLNTISGYMLWFGAATQLLLAGVFHQVYQANLSTAPKLGDMVWIYLGAYFAFTLIWMVRMLSSFSRPG